MKKYLYFVIAAVSTVSLSSCSHESIAFETKKIEMVNRDIVVINATKNSIELNRKKGDGLAILKDETFEEGEILVEIKGENNPGKSFVGIAFNIQNDSVYEAVYFRPFNFQSEEQIRREHSMQYIYHPKNTWRYLRTNFEGQYEATFPRKPNPDDWFAVRLHIDDTHVTVYDSETDAQLLKVERLTTQTSDRIALWTGFNSKGWFRNLKIDD